MSGKFRLTVFSRRDCHLCEALLDELAPMVSGRAEVVTVDVDADPGLTAVYGALVPVVEGEGGEELSRYFLDADRVRAYLSGRP